jgi:hypothetical protein
MLLLCCDVVVDGGKECAVHAETATKLIVDVFLTPITDDLRQGAA